MNLNINEWKNFYLYDLFGEAPRGTRITTSDRIQGKIPFVTAGEQNEGVSEKIANDEAITYKNAITIDMFGNSFYHEYEFKTDDNVLTLINNEFINIYTGCFIATVISKDKYKNSYGRQYRQKDYKKHMIKLPIEYELNDDGSFKLDDENNKIPKIDLTYKYSKEGYIPNFKFMENYIKSLNSKPITTSSGGGINHIPLVVEEWKEFTFKDFFLIDRGKRLIEDDREKGNIKYFSASQTNNGCTDHISNPLFLKENSLIYSTFGDCYYVNDTFTASDEISILSYPNINVYNALFIVTIINQNKYKYAFGRKAFKDKFENEKFKLPIEYELNNDGSIKLDNEYNKIPKIDSSCKYSKEGYIPDFEFMENYIKQLYYSDRI